MTDSNSLDALVVRLADKDPVVSAEARARLLDNMESIAPQLISALRELSAHERSDPRAAATIEALIDVLVTGGDAVLAPLSAAVPAAWAADRGNGENTWRVVPPWALKSEVYALHRVFWELRADDVKYLSLLGHREPLVRWWGLWALARSGPAASLFLDEVLTLVNDPEAVVSDRALATLDAMGSEAFARLRALGQRPGPAQRSALSAVAALGGWPLLDSAQRALLTQGVEDQVAHEAPESMWAGGPMSIWRRRRAGDLLGDWTGHWLAVPTDDQVALLDELGLVEAMPTTMQVGMRYSLETGCVFATPQLDGWTLVFGYDLPGGISVESVREWVVGLSRRFGSAHWHFFDDTAAGWALAEDGELVHLRFSEEWAEDDEVEDDEVIGPPHPAELEGESESRGWATFRVAQLSSLDPSNVGPHTRVHGHGVVAGTSPQWHQSLPDRVRSSSPS
ncbi:hypothetical protein ABIA39_008888 [Nocardia sp. GAS34]|uniref:hypothetical protein n=1 Tax=unclassified Nocardia TaxID=2637762 RepID=UPI003D1A3F15